MATVTAQNSSPEKMKLVSCKAGMENVDIEKINEIISEASKGSNFYAHKQESQQQLLKKIEDMKCQLSKATEQQKQASLIKMDKLVAKLEARRDLSHVIVHIDMDAFFAAVETRDNPDLANIPMAVGGDSMLSTSNYHARKFGVRAAMPGFIAKKLCPELTIVRPNFKKYIKVSDEVKEVFAQYDCNFGSMSLDEASLDITDLVDQELLKDDSKTREDISENIVSEIRRKVTLKTNLTCSAGISVNTRLAKVCSDINKPNGQFCLPFTRDKIMEFVNKLPIGKVCGIGRVTEQQLNALDVKTCGDLHVQRENLGILFSEISLKMFMKMSLGLGSIQVYSEDSRKSMSVERTFRDMSDPDQLKSKCAEICTLLSQDLKKENVVEKTVAIKIKTVKFNVKTRAKSLLQHTSSCNVITSAAHWLLEQEIKAAAPEQLKLRLMGVRMSSLLEEHKASSKQQLTLEDVLKNCEKSQNESDGTTYTCPICGNEKSSKSDITKHVNQCLENPEELAVSERDGCTNDETSSCSYQTFGDEICPVCNKKQNYKDNEAFNRHIDESERSEEEFASMTGYIPQTFDRCTCFIIKPHAVKEGIAGKILTDVAMGKFHVLSMNMLQLEFHQAEYFLLVYKGVLPEYPGLVTELAQGPCIIMCIQDETKANNIVQILREFAGPIDPEIARKLRPGTLRAKYGSSKIKNCVHCTDLPEDSFIELEYLFKTLLYTEG